MAFNLWRYSKFRSISSRKFDSRPFFKRRSFGKKCLRATATTTVTAATTSTTTTTATTTITTTAATKHVKIFGLKNDRIRVGQRKNLDSIVATFVVSSFRRSS